MSPTATFIVVWISLCVILAGVRWVRGYLAYERSLPRRRPQRTLLEALRLRYVRGEISVEEFEEQVERLLRAGTADKPLVRALQEASDTYNRRNVQGGITQIRPGESIHSGYRSAEASLHLMRAHAAANAAKLQLRPPKPADAARSARPGHPHWRSPEGDEDY